MTPPDPLCHRCGAPKSQHHALLSHPQQHVALVCPTALFLHESESAAPSVSRDCRRWRQTGPTLRRKAPPCGQPVLGGHADRALDDTCGRHGWRWERRGTTHPAPPNKDRVALDAIAELMSGQEWDADTCDAIAQAVRDTGRTIRDVR